jgi:hypothetical protein
VTTLVLSARHTPDDQALWRAAIARGWAVERVRGIAVPAIDDEELVIYVEALLAPLVAEKLDRQLLDPPEDWLVRLPHALRSRDVALTTLGAARALEAPAFVKPPNDKTFTARVFASGAELPREFDDDTPVLVAEPVRWRAEYRCFCLDGVVRTLSPYLRDGVHAAKVDYAATAEELGEAAAFATRVLAEAATPRAIVIDVGIIDGRGWAVVEANGAWGAGIYGCEPDAVLDVIRRATTSPSP